MLFYGIMIKGIGIDFIEKRRVHEALERWGRHFTERILTEQEAAQCGQKGDRVGSIAARFAAKEAVLKALGTGWSKEVGWKDVEILTDEKGMPHVTLYGGAKKLARNGFVRLSLSHSHEQAAAMVVIESEEESHP
jgi:holo-[acyl-carrier protein] synthase